MTNELIKALMVLVLYGVLELALFSSSESRFPEHAVRSRGRRPMDDEKELGGSE